MVMDVNQDLNHLQNLTADSAEVRKSEVGSMRSTILHDVAIGIGARGGLAWRYDQINNTLEKVSKNMDTLWNFRALLISKTGPGVTTTAYAILPPVLVEADNIYLQADDDNLKIANVSYKIESQAKFVTTAPTWRDYVIHGFDSVDTPHPSLLPKNDTERAVWKAAINEGWVSGIKQADSIFTSGLSSMKRDYEGMVRYRYLLAHQMVSEPFVAEALNGVTGDGDQMNIDERALKITSKPQFNSKTNEWKIIPRKVN